MIPVTKADLISLAPEFSSVGEAAVNLFITNARLFVSEEHWGEDKGKQGIIWMAAHMMKKVGFGNSSSSATTPAHGQVTQEKVGDLSRSYSQIAYQGMKAMDAVLSTTPYGQLFIQIRKTIPSTPLVI